jgi:hypothetical protein
MTTGYQCYHIRWAFITQIKYQKLYSFTVNFQSLFGTPNFSYSFAKENISHSSFVTFFAVIKAGKLFNVAADLAEVILLITLPI